MTICAMVIYGNKLRENTVWRLDKFWQEMHDYAKSIGCEFFQDEIICNEKQSELMAQWWRDHTTS